MDKAMSRAAHTPVKRVALASSLSPRSDGQEAGLTVCCTARPSSTSISLGFGKGDSPCARFNFRFVRLPAEWSCGMCHSSLRSHRACHPLVDGLGKRRESSDCLGPDPAPPRSVAAIRTRCSPTLLRRMWRSTPGWFKGGSRAARNWEAWCPVRRARRWTADNDRLGRDVSADPYGFTHCFRETSRRWRRVEMATRPTRPFTTSITSKHSVQFRAGVRTAGLLAHRTVCPSLRRGGPLVALRWTVGRQPVLRDIRTGHSEPILSVVQSRVASSPGERYPVQETVMASAGLPECASS